jgi:hypothetical protein
MPNKNYNKGRAFEYKTINYLRKKGYWCVRAWGSKGVYDLMAVPISTNPHIPFGVLQELVPLSIKKPLTLLPRFFKGSLLIQAKTNGYVPPKELEKIKQNLSKDATSLISFDYKHKVHFKSIDGEIQII